METIFLVMQNTPDGGSTPVSAILTEDENEAIKIAKEAGYETGPAWSYVYYLEEVDVETPTSSAPPRRRSARPAG